MDIRVKNTTKGQRGIYVDGELVFVDPNATSTFTNASAAERDAAAEIDGLRVQSRVSHDGEWRDHFKEEMPAEKPWLALSNDPAGADYKALPDGTWYVGIAVAGERPDGAGGYKWVKVGSTPADEEVNGGDASEAVAVDDDAPVDLSDGKFDANAFVDRNGNTVIADIEAGKATDLEAVRAAENKRQSPRKGVIAALDAAKG